MERRKEEKREGQSSLSAATRAQVGQRQASARPASDRTSPPGQPKPNRPAITQLFWTLQGNRDYQHPLSVEAAWLPHVIG